MKNTKQWWVVVGVILLILLAMVARKDRVSALEDEYTEKRNQLQKMQYNLKQARQREREAMTSICETLKEKATVMLEEDNNLTEERKAGLIEKTKLNCSEYVVDTLQFIYTEPSDLSYVFLKSYGTYITQSFREHFANNGYMAVDIGTGGKKLDVYAPSFMKEQAQDLEREYTVKIIKNYHTMGFTVELHWKEGKVPYNWAIGHLNEVYVKDGQKVKTGDKIALSGGCVGELQFDEKSTGCHVHLEFRVDGVATPYPTFAYTKHSGEQVKTCYKKDVDKDQQQYVRIASDISGGDIRFLALLNGENGLWTLDRVHADGVGRGLCGISYPWHKDIIEDERFLTDAKWQIEQCYKLWKGGTKFYGDIDGNLDKFICLDK